MSIKSRCHLYCINGLAKGCQYCVRGKKLVLFVSGVCPRNCYYCSLSEKRKNKDVVWANERVCKSPEEAVEEAELGNATGAGITGGDPNLFVQRTLSYARAFKKRFGKQFHLHIYLPTDTTTPKRLSAFSSSIDEVRFHPAFLIRPMNVEATRLESEKILKAVAIFGKANVGIELPMLPDKKKEILSYLKQMAPYIGFINLNEFEASDTNFSYLTKHHRLKDQGYLVSGSREAGLWVLKQLNRKGLKTKINLCTADSKLNYQYRNRLRNHQILPFGKKTSEGTVVYYAIYPRNSKELQILSKHVKGKEAFFDKKKRRVLVSRRLALALSTNYTIIKSEEYPTFDGMEVEIQALN